MPIDIEQVTTEVSLPDRDGAMSPRQMERIVQEVFRRLEAKMREDERAANASSFSGRATGRT